MSKTTFEKIGIPYEERDGIFYPVLVAGTEKADIDAGKYGRMWIKYIKEEYPMRYKSLVRFGELEERANEVNETAYEKTAEDKNAIAYVSSGVELDDNKVKTVTIYGNDLTRSFYLAYKGELNDVEDDFVRYISTQGQEVVSEKYTAVAKPGSFLSDKAGGEIKIGGSTSATPLVKELADKYMEINPNAKITVTETDSGNGLTGAMEGTYDIGMSSRELKSYENELLTKVEIAKDEVHVIVNKENPIERISIEQLGEIYTGKLTEWAQLNGKAEDK